MAEPHFIPVCEWEDADGLPGGWRQGFEGWSFAKRLLLRNDLAEPRSDEPVEVELEYHAGQVADPRARSASSPSLPAPAPAVSW